MPIFKKINTLYKGLVGFIISIKLNIIIHKSKNNKLLSKKTNIEKLFIKKALDLIKGSNYRVFDINITLENKNNLKLLYRLKQEYHLLDNLKLEWYPINKTQEILLNILQTPMSENIFLQNFHKLMSEHLKELILTKNDKYFVTYLTEEMNYLNLQNLSLQDILKYLKNIYDILKVSPEMFFVHFKHVQNKIDFTEVSKDIENTIFEYMFNYDELVFKDSIELDIDKELDRINKQNNQNFLTKTLRRNFKEDSISCFLEETFNILPYQAFIRKGKL